MASVELQSRRVGQQIEPTSGNWIVQPGRANAADLEVTDGIAAGDEVLLP